MVIYLGIGPYERDQPSRPSIHKARSIFLRFLDGFSLPPTSKTSFKNVAPTDLYDSVFLSYIVLIFERFDNILFSETARSSFTSDVAIFLHIKNSISPDEVKDFLPDHLSLKRESPTTHAELVAWASKWNINCDWCLDFAVEALRMWLFETYARSLRLWGPAIKDDSNSFEWEAVVEQVIEENFDGGFSFEFENFSFSTASWNYRLEDASEWRREITGQFVAHLCSFIERGGTFPPRALSRLVKQFEGNVEARIRKIKTYIKERGYEPVPQVRDSQFAWTMCYQVLELNLSEIARNFNQPERTVADGIDRTVTLLGLKKRPGRRGRKRGVVGGTRKRSIREEANRRMRLGRFIAALAKVPDPQKKATVARAIGISPYHFRREWVPYLIKETGSKDYFTLIRKYQ